MKLFENMSCELCGHDDSIELYTSKQYVDHQLKDIEVNIVLCKNCNFIYQNPQLTEESLMQHYLTSSSGDTYKLEGGIALKERVSFIEEAIKDLDLNSICDIGGGTGELIRTLKSGNHVKKYLVEPSNAIDKCIDSKIVKIKIPLKDVHCEHFSTKPELLLCVNVLEHLKSPLSMMKKFNELLDNQGHLFIEVPNSLKPDAQFAEFFSYEHLNHFTTNSLINILQKSGFYPISIAASISIPTIRIIAKKNSIEEDKNCILTVFKDYINQKSSLINQLTDKIKDSITKNKIKSLAVYGAGEHTRFILASVDISSIITYYIDSDPTKWNKKFLGKNIIGPNQIVDYNISNILISSYDFESEIYETIINIAPDINIITLYRHINQ